MPFNGPIDGDYTNVDFTQGPWTNNECMTLTHDECLHVIEGCQSVVDNYDSSTNYGMPISETEIHSGYNKLDWQYAINWNTFTALQGYNPEVNTLGINEFGIILPEPEPEPTPEEPTEEPPAEEQTGELDEPSFEEQTEI